MPEIEYGQSTTEESVSLWREAISFYAARPFAVIKVLLPPAVIAYLAALICQHEIELIRARVIASGFRVFTWHDVGAYELLMLPMQLWLILKQWFLWICYCFAIIGICNFVRDYSVEEDRSSIGVFSTIRDRPVRFLSSATLFFGVLVLAFAGMMFILTGIVEIQQRAHIPYAGARENWVSTLGAIALISAVLVRWAFAVPVAVLKDLPFSAAMRLSDQLTNHRMLQLWALAMESEVAGYFALIAPSYVLFYLHLPLTPFNYYCGEAAAILLSAVSQTPLMLAIAIVLARHTPESEPMHSSANRKWTA